MISRAVSIFLSLQNKFISLHIFGNIVQKRQYHSQLKAEITDLQSKKPLDKKRKTIIILLSNGQSVRTILTSKVYENLCK